MNKQELLEELKEQIKIGEIRREEVLPLLSLEKDQQFGAKIFKLSDILYYIGGGIIFIGIIILCYQNWDNFHKALRILITMGSFIASFVVAAILNKYQNFKKGAMGFFLIAGLLMPLSLFVVFNELGVDMTSRLVNLSLAAIATAIFLCAFSIWKNTLLLFFSVVFSSWLFFASLFYLAGDNLSSGNYSKIFEYGFLVLGIAYIFMARFFQQNIYRAMSGLLFAFGATALLGAAMALGGNSPDQNIFWELAYPFLVFGLIFSSVYVRSKSLLVFGTIFLIIYILKITAEYFKDSNLWPLALVLAGLLIMVIGFYAVKINKKYFLKEVTENN